jgi:hypothetical protein
VDTLLQLWAGMTSISDSNVVTLGTKRGVIKEISTCHMRIYSMSRSRLMLGPLSDVYTLFLQIRASDKKELIGSGLRFLYYERLF